ncbi:hypothetical protein TKK_0015099 [Trichogramma kaykai]
MANGEVLKYESSSYVDGNRVIYSQPSSIIGPHNRFHLKIVGERTPMTRVKSKSKDNAVILQLRACSRVKYKCVYEVTVASVKERTHLYTKKGCAIIESNRTPICVTSIDLNVGQRARWFLKILPLDKNLESSNDCGFSLNEDSTNKLNFDWLFLNENLSDVKLLTMCGKEIPAHKVVLASASPVFKAMFCHDMLETKSQTVDMADISHDAALAMMRYIYTGILDIPELSLAAEILKAADKYLIEDFERIWQQKLISSISTENVMKLLKIADTCDSKYLKEEAVEFIAMNVNKLATHNAIINMLLGKKT